jgi:hypothetical protein
MVLFSLFLDKIQSAIELDVTETGPDQDHQWDNGYCFSLALYRISRQELIRFVHSIVRTRIVEFIWVENQSSIFNLLFERVGGVDCRCRCTYYPHGLCLLILSLSLWPEALLPLVAPSGITSAASCAQLNKCTIYTREVIHTSSPMSC